MLIFFFRCIFDNCIVISIFAAFNQPNIQLMKQTLTLLAALTLSAASSFAQVGIGTIQPETTLHLYSETEYPVLRLEKGGSSPDPASGRVEWVYRDGTTDKGYSLHAADGELRISKLTDNTLVQQDYPSVSLEPES